MYRRIALVAAALSLVAGGLLVWALLRPYQDVQRFYGAALGIAGLLVGGVLLAGAVSIPAAEGQATWRGSGRGGRDRGRRGDRVDHCWCRHGRGGGDHQPGPSTRAQARFRPPTRSRYAARRPP
jgi:hypothetical protein